MLVCGDPGLFGKLAAAATSTGNSKATSGRKRGVEKASSRSRGPSM